MSDSLRGRVAFNNSWRQLKGLLPTLDATDPAGSDYDKTSTFPNYAVSANMDWVASPNLFFGIRGGYYMSDWHDANVTEVPRYNWTTTNNIGFLDVPASLQRATGFSSVLSNNKVVKDQQTRANFQADGTVYGKLGGDHQMKFGASFDRVGNNVDSGEAAARVTLRWNQCARRSARHLRLLLGQERRPHRATSSRASPRRATSDHAISSDSSCRMRGRSTTG